MRSPRVRGVRGEGGASDGQVFLVLRRGEPERLRRGPPQQRQARRPASLVQERHRASRVRGGVRRQARLARRPHGQVPRRGVRATRRIQRDGVCLLGSPSRPRGARGDVPVSHPHVRLVRRRGAGRGRRGKPRLLRRDPAEPPRERRSVRIRVCAARHAVPPLDVRQPRDQLLVRRLRVRVARQCTTARRASTRVSLPAATVSQRMRRRGERRFDDDETPRRVSVRRGGVRRPGRGGGPRRPGARAMRRGCASTRPRATSKGRVRVRARVAVSPMSRARLPSKRGDARGDTVRGGARTVSEGLRRVALQVGNRSAPAGTMPASRRRLPVQRPGVRRDGGARIDGFAPPTRRGRAP